MCKYRVIRADGKIAVADLTHYECVALSEHEAVAAIVAIDETANGMHAAYIGGTMTQYDPVSGRMLCYGTTHDRRAGRNGWVS